MKYIGYVLLFIFSFILFIYWTFPYEILKDRFITAAEQQLGGAYDVRISSLSPSFFTGAVLKQVKILKHEGENVFSLWEAPKVKVRIGLFSLLFGKPGVSFYIKQQKGSLSGSLKKTDDGFNVSGDFSNFNLGEVGALAGGSGLKLISEIDGSAQFSINKKQMVQSTGQVDLSLSNIKITAGELKLGETVGTFQMPEIILSKGSGSKLQFELSKGGVRIKEFKLKDGDLGLSLDGDVFISSVFKNYRMNLKGTFSSTPKLEQTIPILFMIEKQRQEDGTYPITITGRLSQPSIKIGEFTVPL